MNDFGKRLKQAREAKKLTQVQLAAAVGFAQGTISGLERGGRASTTKTAQLATVLGVDPLWLAEGVGTPEVMAVEERLSKYGAPSINDRVVELFEALTLSQQSELLMHMENLCAENSRMLSELTSRRGQLKKIGKPQTTEIPREDGLLFATIGPDGKPMSILGDDLANKKTG